MNYTALHLWLQSKLNNFTVYFLLNPFPEPKNIRDFRAAGRRIWQHTTSDRTEAFFIRADHWGFSLDLHPQTCTNLLRSFHLYTIQNVHSPQVHIHNPQRNVAVSVSSPPTATLALMIDLVRPLLDLMTGCCQIERFCRHCSSLKIAAL